MNTKNHRIRPRFGLETRFDVPLPAGSFPGKGVAELERLKERLLQELLGPADPAWVYAPLRRAANDAAAIAWMTPCPLLVLPSLLEEKVQAARRQAQRQQEVLLRSRALVSEAA
ncbi:MAG: hypothetical protein ACYDH9_22465 [Limisphaerales bacterium]